MTLPRGAGPTGGRFAGVPYEPEAPDTTPSEWRSVYVAAAPVAALGGQLVAKAVPGAGVTWFVRRITVQADAVSDAVMYVGEPGPSGLDWTSPENQVAATAAGDNDENDTLNPYVVTGPEQLVIWWQSSVPTSAGMRIEFQEVVV